MEKLATIQKHDNLNTVYRDGAVGPGGVYYEYVVSFGDGVPADDEDKLCIRLQCGPRRDSTAQNCSASLMNGALSMF